MLHRPSSVGSFIKFQTRALVLDYHKVLAQLVEIKENTAHLSGEPLVLNFVLELQLGEVNHVI